MSAPTYPELIWLAFRRDPVVRVTTYGKPSDPFVRVVDSISVDAARCVHVSRETFARGYVDQFTCAVGFR